MLGSIAGFTLLAALFICARRRQSTSMSDPIQTMIKAVLITYSVEAFGLRLKQDRARQAGLRG